MGIAVLLRRPLAVAGTLQFLLDIELLNRADYFVGTTNSGLPHLIDVLRFAVRGCRMLRYIQTEACMQNFLCSR